MESNVLRVAGPSAETGPELGPLLELPGTWVGSGFSLISRPDKHDNKPFFLQINATKETLHFDQIGAPIPNRGSGQDDIFFLGVHYLQEISDVLTSAQLHLEPGIWLNIPETTDPPAPPSVVRLATIPHGDALLAQGNSLTVSGGPEIQPADSTPIFATGPNAGKPVTGAYLDPFSNTPLPPGIPAGSIANPNLVLTNAIKNQKIVETTVLNISTTTVIGGNNEGSAGGIENIPFVVQNANAQSMTATFWVEKVQREDGPGSFVQLQYTQRVDLNFLGIIWPHITVATLIKH